MSEVIVVGVDASETAKRAAVAAAKMAKALGAELHVISGFGVETVGIDAGQAGSLDPMFPVHSFLLGADKYGVTSLRNVDRLPVTGATLVVAPLPIVGGTGSPSRVYALVESGPVEER